VSEPKSGKKGRTISVVIHTVWNNKKICVDVDIKTTIKKFEALLCHQLVQLPFESTLRFIFQGRELKNTQTTLATAGL
jgi:hypothetical protein